MSNYRFQITKLYISMFNRAPDAGGLEYWEQKLENGEIPSLSAIAQAMYETQDARAYYPAGATNESVIKSFYQYVLGRDPDPQGLAYWKQYLDSGKSFGEVAVAMIDAVDHYNGTDPAGLKSKTLFENKVQVAQTFVVADGSVEGAQKVLADVSDDPATVGQKTEGMLSDWFDALRANSVLQPYSGNNDSIVGTAGDDRIDAGAGHDTVDGKDGADLIVGGSGDDKLYGGLGQDSLDGGLGADYLSAGSYYSSSYVSGYYDSQGAWVPGYSVYTFDAHDEVLRGGGGADTIDGGYGRDLIFGDDGADYIQGEYAYYYINPYVINPANLGHVFNDTIYGGGGADTIYGHQGDDFIDGGEGVDTIYGGAGADTIYGGAGNDTVQGEGSDSVDLGAGDDRFSFWREENNAFAVVRGGEGADYFSISSNNHSSDRLVIDLGEAMQAKDEVQIGSYGSNPLPVEIVGFDLSSDRLDLIGPFDLYGRYRSTGILDWKYSAVDTDWQGNVTASYVQFVNSPATAWSPASPNPIDAKGKGIFVIQGGAAASEDVQDVAAFLDPYGNNAKYDNRAAHYFIVNIADKGVGIYLFQDDTGADEVVVADELTPVALLVGVNTSQLSLQNIGFLTF